MNILSIKTKRDAALRLLGFMVATKMRAGLASVKTDTLFTLNGHVASHAAHTIRRYKKQAQFTLFAWICVVSVMIFTAILYVRTPAMFLLCLIVFFVMAMRFVYLKDKIKNNAVPDEVFTLGDIFDKVIERLPDGFLDELVPELFPSGCDVNSKMSDIIQRSKTPTYEPLVQDLCKKHKCCIEAC